MGCFPSDRTIVDLSELKDYITPHKSTHYIMKVIGVFTAKHPGKVKPIKNSIPNIGQDFEPID